MTVSSTSSRVVYQGNGATTVFPFAFKILQAADLVVVYTDATGTDHALSPSQYAASGFGADAGGTVTYPTSGSPIASGTTLTLYREVAPTQPTQIGNQGAMWPQVIEAALDRIVMIGQGVVDTAARCLKISPTDGASLNALPTATQRANGVLAFDSSGQPYAAQGITLASVSTWLAANFLPTSSRAAALSALGGAGVSDNNTMTGTSDYTGGRIKVPTRTAGDSGTDAASTAFVAHALGGTVLRSYLAGATLSNSVTTPNTKLDVAAGAFADDTNTAMLSGAAGTIDFTTTGVNGLDNGVMAANTTYHIFGIGKTDGTTAYLASTSPASPALPTGYSLKRRIGSVLTDGAVHIRAFSQNGDEFLWTTVSQDLTTTIGPTATSYALKVPAGIVVNALFIAQIAYSAGAIVTLFSPAQASGVTYTPSASSPNSLAAVIGSSGNFAAGAFNIRVDVAGTIKAVGNVAGIGFYVATIGWIDRRGRDG